MNINLGDFNKLRIHCIQHVPFETPANIEKWAKLKSHKLSLTKMYEYNVMPDLDAFELLLVLGGPMNIYEEDKYSWLKNEKQFIKYCIDNNKAVIGICLGAQLIADVLGAKVYKNNYKEIGWYKLNKLTKNSLFKDFADEFIAFHWHGDTFDLPENCELIASSEACNNQGFIYKNNAIGLQFHIESTQDSVKQLLLNCSDELTEEKYIQTHLEIESTDAYKELERNLFNLLDNLEKTILQKGETYDKQFC